MVVSGRSLQLHLLAVYIAAGAFFAALAARGFLVPLRAHELGADRLTVGLLFAVSTLSAALLSIPAGFLADHFGRREMIALSALLAGATQLGIALTADVRLYFAMQLLGGVGAGAAQAALYASVVDAAPPSQLGRAMGWLTLSMQVGFLSGPAIAGLLAPFMNLSGDLLATTAVSAVPIGAAVLFEGRRQRPVGGWDVLTPMRHVVASPGFLPITLGLFGATLIWGTTQAYIPLFGKEVLGLPASAIGYMLAFQAVANGLSRIPGGRIVDRAARKGSIVAIGTAAFAAAVLLLPHLSGFWAPTALLVLSVPFIATAFIALGVSFSTLGSEAGRGTAMGFYGAVLFLGLAAGPSVFGGVMDRGGYVAGFSACAVTVVAICGIMLVTRARDLRTRTPEVVLPPPAPGT